MEHLSITQARVEVRARLSRLETRGVGGAEVPFSGGRRRLSRTMPASLMRSFCWDVVILVGDWGPACPLEDGDRGQFPGRGADSTQECIGFWREAQDPGGGRKDPAAFAQILPPAPGLASQRPRPQYLHSGLGQPDTQRQLLAHEDVGVVRLSEASLQLVELRRGEARPVALLLLLALLLAGLAGVRAALGPRLLVRVLCAHRQRGRRGAHGGDVLPRQESGSLDWVGVGR